MKITIILLLTTFVMTGCFGSSNGRNTDQQGVGSSDSITTHMDDGEVDDLHGEDYEQSTELSQEAIESIYRQLRLKYEDVNKEQDYNIRRFVSKQLPYDSDLTAVVIAKIAEESSDLTLYDSYILLVITETGEIINKFFEAGGWESDAIELKSISIDTAPYKLNADTRAFGIRCEYANNSRIAQYAQVELSLFVPEGKGLRRVLKNFAVSSHRGEWDGNWAGEFTDSESVLSIEKAKTGPYFDIRVKTQTTITTNIVVDPKGSEDGFESEEKQKHSSTILRFTDGEYKE